MNYLLAVMLLGSVCFLFSAAAATYAELKPYFEVRNTPAARILAAEQSLISIGLSNTAHTLALHDCAEGTYGYLGRAQPGARRLKFITNCMHIADDIIASSPANGYAWALRATVLAELGDVQGFNASMIRSQAVMPSEQFLAAIRVRVMEANYDIISDASLTVEMHDLGILVLSQSGIRTIARRYVSDESFRNRIIDIVDTLPEDAQRRFIMFVRREART